MVEFIGRAGDLALFSNNETGVVIDTNLNLVIDSGDLSVLSARNQWEISDETVPSNVLELAAGATTSLDINVITASGRMYTIPAGAQAEAKKALEWRKEEKRGGTPVGVNTARTLAKGGQIGLEKVRHIAKYFPRHEVDKKGKGWTPGEDNFPSNGRIAWALWGGDAAWRWAAAIVERENKKAVTADGYMLPGYQDSLDTYMSEDSYESDVDAFKLAHELDANVGPEFVARVRLDGTGMDRLYKIDIDGTVCVWDEQGWDALGHVDGDIYTYDRALDDPYDTCEKTHVIIDPSSAVIMSAMFQEDPFRNISVEDLELEEANLVRDAIDDEDWQLVDFALTAAGEVTKATAEADSTPGVYTPDERSANTKKQARDAKGLFVKAGNRVVVAGDAERGSGEVTGVNETTGKVTVKLDNGNSIEVDAKMTENEVTAKTGPRLVPQVNTPLDVSGILGEPRTPIDQPKAHLPGTMKPISRKELNLMMTNWGSYVSGMRKSYKPLDSADKARVEKRYGSLTSAGEVKEEALTPKTTDVAPKYFAIVSPDDPAAVMDMVALVPETKTTTTPISYKRENGQWIRDDQIVMDLKSESPPPVVLLDKSEDVNSVLKQVDGLENVAASAFRVLELDHVLTVLFGTSSLTAAGGLDRNRGKAEELRQYWTRGKGAAKIRWGTPGDWTRCVRHLSKYMGTRAKGYCQLRHKEATGVYTGSRFNPGKENAINEVFANSIVEQAALTARAAEARARFNLVAGADMPKSGSAFSIPLVIPEDLESGDGRKFKKDSIEIRDLPLPLLWQIKTGEGHMGSVVVGRIDHMERIENGIGNATGVFDGGEYGREAERLVRNGFIRGVSADLDQFEAKEQKDEAAEDETLGGAKLTINHARVMAVTIVPKPAFQECTIALVADDYASEEEDMIPEDGIYEETVEAELPGAITASGFLKQEIPVTPPSEWFSDPKLTKPTPITVGEDGRIFGHIAAWHVSHIGMPRSTRPPRSRSKYAYFHTGVCRTAEGSDIPVGQLTLAGGHASLQADAAAAAKHYDDTASAIADVHMGEDEFGIWCAGSVRPDATEMQIRALRASAPSGDWRPINGSLELVAVCQVNVPGFPVARAMVASGKIMALVAAGAHEMAILKSAHVNHFAQKAQTLGELAATAPNLKARVASAKSSIRQQALVAAATQAEDLRQRALTAAAVAELAKFSEEDRKELARKGWALPDGSFPIRNIDDLKNAIQAFGRAKNQAEAKKHIIKRAKDLHRYYDLIPEEWRSKRHQAFSLREMRDRISELSALVAATPIDEPSEEDIKKLEDAKRAADEETQAEIDAIEVAKNAPDEYDEEGRVKYVPGKTQPRDARGQFRKVLARLKQDLGVAGLQKALEKVENAENLEFAGDYAGAAGAAEDLINTIDRLDSGALDATKLESVRNTAADLGKVIANLPLPFTNQAQKIKFSDLPPALKKLMDDMISRVEQKIGKKDADIATAKLRSYKSGGDLFSQSEISSEMSTLLRLLT